MKKLAEEAGRAVKDIQIIIDAIIKQVNEVAREMEKDISEINKNVSFAAKSEEALSKMAVLADRTSYSINQILKLAKEQAASAEEVDNLVGNIAALSQESAAGAQEAAAAVEEQTQIFRIGV